MRLATCISHTGAVCAALITGDVVRLTSLPDGLAALRAEVAEPGAVMRSVVGEGQLNDFRLLAPIPRPGKILGSGINYVSHKDENPAATMPVEPGFFSKLPSSVVGPDADVLLPSPESQVDYEVELAIVIGRAGRGITRTHAMEHVFGFTLVNDVSARDVQFRAHQMDLGKGFDTFCPMGPWIVTRDEIEDVSAVRLRSRVNGDVRQDASTAEWIYGVPELIEHASRHITLEPGDLISTGTPAGCGTFRQPPVWLAPGDEVVVEADGIGWLRSRLVQGW